MKMHRHVYVSSRTGQRQQRGVALVVGMVFLVMLSLAGLVAMNRTILQERMTGAYRSEQMAYAAAEAGLRDAEWNLWNFPIANNIAYPKLTRPGGNADCSDVCASEAAYKTSATTRLKLFLTQEPSDALASASAGNGIIANANYMGGSMEGSRSAFPPMALTEYINSADHSESLPTGQSGLDGNLRLFRITSRGFGPTGDIERQLQSTYTLVQ